VNVSDLLDETVASFPADIRSRVEVSLPEQTAVLSGDRIRLGTVLRNLVENSARYAPASAIRINVDCADETVVISVVDNGPGLPPGTEESVFDRFTRLEGHLSQTSGGVGLGLAISRGIIEAHGGSIVASRLPVGVSFDVRLPAVEKLTVSLGRDA